MKRSVLGFGSSIPLLQTDGVALGSDPACMAALLINFFEGKQSRDLANRSASCHHRAKLRTFAFMSRDVRRLLSEHDPYGGVDPLEFLPIFFL